jgi:hypothetical protein
LNKRRPLIPAPLQGPDERYEFTDFKDRGEKDRRNDAYNTRGQDTVSTERRYDLRGEELHKKTGGTSYNSTENQGQPYCQPDLRFCHRQGIKAHHLESSVYHGTATHHLSMIS